MGTPYNTLENLLALGVKLKLDHAALVVSSPCPLPDDLRAAIAEHTSRLKEALDPLPLVEQWHPTHQDAFAEAVASMLQDEAIAEHQAHTLAYLILIERQET